MLSDFQTPEERAQRAGEWAKLMDRRSAVVSLLRSVNSQLRRLGRDPISQNAEAQGLTAAAQTKDPCTTRNGRLSWRGIDLANRLFDAFDADADGLLSAAEWRAYLDAVSLSLAGDDAEVVVLVSRVDFLAHREAVEPDHPIEVDALAVGLAATPAVLDEWRTCAREFDALADDDHRGRVPVAHFQLLCANCGQVMAARECELFLRAHVAHNRACAAVRSEHARRHAFDVHQTSSVDANDEAHVYCDAFLAWWFSGRCSPEPLPTYSRFALGACLASCRALRGAKATVERVATTLSGLVARGLLPFERLQAAQTETGALDLAIDVAAKHYDVPSSDSKKKKKKARCERDDEASGAGVEVRFGRVEDPRTFAAEKQIPSAAGSSIIIDIDVRPGTDRAVLTKLREASALAFEHYFAAEFKRACPGFLGLRVLVVGLEENQRKKSLPGVLRFQLLWKPTVDAWLRRVVGVVSVLDAVSVVSGSARSNRGLAEAFYDLDLTASQDLELSASLKATYARDLLAVVLEEVLHARRDAKAVAREDRRLRRQAYEKAQSRTLDSHGPLLKTAGELPEVGITGYVAPTRGATNAVESWATKVQDLLEAHCWRLARALRGTKALQLELGFESLGQLLFDNSLVSTFFPDRAVLHALTSRGGLAAWWAGVSEALGNELDELWAFVDRVEAEERARLDRVADERAKKLAAMSRVDRKRLSFAEAKSKFQLKIGGSKLFLPPPTPARECNVDQIRRLRVEHAAALRVALDLYALCCAALTGPANITLHSDKLRLSLDIHGMDVFDLLP